MSEINLTKRQKKIMINCLKYFQINPPLSHYTGICHNVVLLMKTRRVNTENFARLEVYYTVTNISRNWHLKNGNDDSYPIAGCMEYGHMKWVGEGLERRQLLIQYLIDKLSE